MRRAKRHGASFAWAGLGFCAALALGVGRPGPAMANPTKVTSTRPASIDRRAFDEAVDLVMDHYVAEVDTPEVLGRALRHMVAGLDAHSVYIDAATRERWQKIRARGLTTGMTLRRSTALREGAKLPDGTASPLASQLEVASVLPGSPADRAGLVPGDLVLDIEGVPVSRFPHPWLAQIAATALEGDHRRLKVRRANASDALSIELAAARVDAVQTVQGQLLLPGAEASPSARAKKIGWLRVHAFAPGVAERARVQLRELRRAAGGRLDGLVLDLRGNPGGEVQEALRIAEMFVADGVLVRTRGRGGTILTEERAHRAGTDTELRLVVLQDEDSASASELLAAALKGHGRARIVGRTSHGKGSVQRLYGLPDGAQLRLTIAHYFGPDDQRIDGRGVLPDVPLTLEEMRAAKAHAWAQLAEHR